MTELAVMLSAHARRKSPPAEVERILRVADRAGLLSEETRTTVSHQLRQARRQLEQTACSSAWVNDCWHSGRKFPPAAETTPMVACQCERCRQSGKLWPQYYRAAAATAAQQQPFISYECHLESLSDWDAAQLPSSPSGLALRAIREGHIKLRRQRTYTRARRFIS